MPQLYQDNLGEILRGPQDYQVGGSNTGSNTANATVPGGANMQLQYNANGAFGGVAGTTWDGYDLTLGLVANVKIGGGSDQQLLKTDGTGNLAWVTVDTQALQPQPVINFVAPVDGNNQSFTDANISTFTSNGYATVTRNGVTVDSPDYTIVGDVLTINAYLFVGDDIAVLPTYPAPAVGAPPGGGTVTRVGGQGAGLGFSLSGNVTTDGDLTLTVPPAAQLKNTLDIGTVADINLNGLTDYYLSGTGVWQEINDPITGNVSLLNLTGVQSQVLRGDGTWLPVAVPTGNIGNINLNGNSLQVLAGNGSWVPQGGGGGVTQIVAGTNISISPPGGTGVVTISSTGGNGGSGTVTSVSGNGGGLGFSLGGTVVSAGNITLAAPSAAALRTSLTIGTAANVNLNGNGSQWLNGAGVFANIAVPTVGNIATLNLSGVSTQYLSGDGSWDTLNLPSGNIVNVNLNGITTQYLNGAGSWANIAVPTGNIANTNYNGNNQTWLNGNGTWANIPIPVVGTVGLLNLNNLGNQFLAGNGVFREINMPITGNIAGLNLNGNTQNWLRGDGAWANIAVPTGNIGNVNLNSDGTTWLRGNGTFANIAVPTGTIGNVNLNGDTTQYLRGDGAWSPVIAPAAGNTTEIQFNNNNSLSSSANLTYDRTGGRLIIGRAGVSGILVTNIITAQGTTPLGINGPGVTFFPSANSNITFNNNGISNISIEFGKLGSEANTNVRFYSSNVQLGSNTAVHITGGSAGQVLATDGGGNLSWIAAGGTGTVQQVGGSGTGLGFSLTGNVTTSGNLILTAPTVADFRTITNIGNVANANFTGNGLQILAGNGAWVAQDGSVTRVTGNGSALGFALGGTVTTTGNITLTGPDVNTLRSTLSIGNVANLNLNGNGSQVLAGNGAWITQPGANTSNLTNIVYGTENITLNYNSATGTTIFDVLSNAIQWNTATSTANVTLNIRGNATTTLNNVLSVGQSTTATFLMSNGGTPYGVTVLQIDGAIQTIRWAGANSTPGTSSVMAHTFTMIKTGANAYTVLGSMTRYT